MGLTSNALLYTVSALAILTPILVAVLWRRSVKRGTNGPLNTVGRWLGILLCQVLAVMSLFLYVNQGYTFYTSWSDLFGVGTTHEKIKIQGLVGPGQGTAQVIDVAGGPSGATGQQVLVWLPKQYEDPAYAHTKFPVLTVLPGQPSGVDTMFRHFNFARVASEEIDSGRVSPFIAVFPPIMINPPRDTECTNVRNGPQALTWLAQDVPDAVLARYRVQTSASQWSVMGWSTGAFCAAKVLLTTPQRFMAAASLGGYYEPITDRTTGRLFGRSAIRRDANSPLHIYQKQGLAPGQSFLMVSGEQDRESWPMTTKMIHATTGDDNVYTLVFPTGGHNYRNYNSYLADTLMWFQQRGVFGTGSGGTASNGAASGGTTPTAPPATPSSPTSQDSASAAAAATASAIRAAPASLG